MLINPNPNPCTKHRNEASVIPLFPLSSSCRCTPAGPCYLHSCLTSSDVFTWEMCNTTLWFSEEDNLCFRQGEAATARGVRFPSLLFTECGRFLLRSARLQWPPPPSPPRYRQCPQTNLLRGNRQIWYRLRALLLLSLSLSLSSLCSCLPSTVSDSICLGPYTSCFLSLTISPSVRGLM